MHVIVKYCNRINSASSKPSQDLLGLDLFGASSSSSTPTGGNYSFPSPANQRESANTSNVTTPTAAQGTRRIYFSLCF